MERADWVGFSPPPADTLIFVSDTLPSLLYTSDLTVAAQSPGPIDYTFDGFPNALKVVQNSMTLSQLGATDLTFLSNLVCAPAGTTTISNNPSLAYLSGLIAYFYDVGQGLTMASNPLLTQFGLQPLGFALQCDGASWSSSPLTLSTFSVEINNKCSGSYTNPLTSVNELCGYLVDPACSGGPSVVRPSAPGSRPDARSAGQGAAPQGAPCGPVRARRAALPLGAPTRQSSGPVAVSSGAQTAGRGTLPSSAPVGASMGPAGSVSEIPPNARGRAPPVAPAEIVQGPSGRAATG